LKQEVERLKAQIISCDKDKTIAVNEVITKKKDEIVEKDIKISELLGKLKEAEKDSH
jgi:hypothetical protein